MNKAKPSDIKTPRHGHLTHHLSSRLVPAGMAVIFCAGLTALFWPGVGTWEVLQFEMQRQLPVMNDWKSPFVAGLYGAADDIFNSTGPILLFQQITFWLGLALLSQHTWQHTIAKSIFFLIVAILPLTWTTGIMLWKEAWTLSFLSLSIGAIFACLNTGKGGYAVLAVISSILLSTTRQNAVLLAFPALYLGARLIADRAAGGTPGKHRLIFWTIIAILVAITFSFLWVCNKKGKQRCHIWHHTLIWDLAAISLYEGKNLVPDEFRKSGIDGSLNRISDYFTYYNSDPLFYGRHSPFKLYGTAASPCNQNLPLDALLRSWSCAVRTYPGIYLRHRLLYLIHLLGIDKASEDYWGRKYYRNDSEYSSKVNQASLYEHLRKNAVYESLVSGNILPGWLYILLFICSGWKLSSRKNTASTCLWMIWIAGFAYFCSFAVMGSAAVMRFLSVYAILGPAVLAGRWSTLNRFAMR